MKRLAHHVWRKTRVVTLPRESEGYREEHRISRWALLPLGFFGVATVWVYSVSESDSGSRAPAVAAGAALLVLLLAASLRIAISVDAGSFTYQVWPFYTKRIPLADVDHVAEFTIPGHWIWGGVLTLGSYVEGTQRVQLHLNDGRTVSVSAYQGHALAAAIRNLKGIEVAR